MRSSLQKRILSSLVMLPVVLLLLWFGGYAWMILLAAISGVAIHEWWRLTRPFALWQALAGIPYILLTTYALWDLRENNNELYEFGLILALFIIALLACIDIGAYVFGKTIGGRKLAPTISPGKTWAGLFGAMITAAGFFAYVCPTDFPKYKVIYALVGAGLAVLAQGGDLFESWLKRRAGVKDSGTLIPGHGGVLDRIDGYLTTVPIVWLLWEYFG